MKHTYQKINFITTIVLTGVGAYLGSQGLISPKHDHLEGAGIGIGLGLATGLALYGLTKIGISALEKCLDLCGSNRENIIKALLAENEFLKTRAKHKKKHHRLQETESHRFLGNCPKNPEKEYDEEEGVFSPSRINEKNLLQLNSLR